ncbi:cytochrome P450 monooxygenase [Lophiotrema nucula]|uniref:Cytochrome P450 monooxygenase n=1 Tax=Lophiotrema nucula TaxID=690887 RepID=A0A6A5YJP0_9PLEO|nr:cytochrome P450 monooxygenase [Lophiotrema nucula]
MPLFDLLLFLPASLALYWSWLIISRLWLSPLSQFPGPKLAALTTWYEFYYDIVLGGRFPWQMRELHAKYGPVVRITPEELSVSDPHFYATLYASAGKRRDKWKPVPGQKWVKDSVAGSMSHELHRMRRSALNPVFSVQRLTAQQDSYKKKIARFMERMDGFAETGEKVLAWRVLAALANDSIMTYCLGHSYDRLETSSFQELDDNDEILQNLVGGHRMKQFGYFPRIMESVLFRLPHSFLAKILPPFASFLREQKHIGDQTRSLVRGDKGTGAPATLLETLLQSKLSNEEKEPERIAQESMTTVIAGTHGTSFALSTAIYYLLSSPPTLKRLKAELTKAIPDLSTVESLSWKDAEQLPYLKGVVQEALRLSYGSIARLPRISPVDSLTVPDPRHDKPWVIPPGTPIGMSSFVVHHDESVFPDSDDFKPERWVENPGLERYMVSFTKGSRSCLGMNLAYALMYLTLMRVFREYGSPECRDPGDKGYLELVDTELSDVVPAIDGFIPLSRNGSHGLQFIVREYTSGDLQP